MKIKYTTNKYLMQGSYMNGDKYFEEFATLAERANALQEIKACYAEYLKEPMRRESVVNPHGLFIGREIVVK